MTVCWNRRTATSARVTLSRKTSSRIFRYESCVFSTFLKTESYVYLSHIQNVFFFPRIFPEHFSKAVFIIILKRQQIFVNFRITVKKVFSSLGINKSTMRKTISMWNVRCFFFFLFCQKYSPSSLGLTVARKRDI